VTRDTVTPKVAAIVARRDGYRCVTSQLDGRAGWCHDKWGNVITHWRGYIENPDPYLTLAHIKTTLAMGKRAPSDPGHLALICWGHHEGVGEKGGNVWATKRENLEKLRRYLASFGGEA